MKRIHTLFAVLFLEYLGVNTNVYSAENGGKCELNPGSVGTCLNVEKCPDAIALIRGGGRPKTCGFSGKNPMVCCEDTAKPYGLIAKQKCSEYEIASAPTTTVRSSFGRRRLHGGGHGIGGRNALPLEFPHMAILGYGSEDAIRWQCGGSLVNENYVLTAAHCVQSKYGQVQFVKLGVHEIGRTHGTIVQSFRVGNIVTHPKYAPSKGYHDIALLKLDHPADIQKKIRPACLHTNKELPNETFVATGWGATELYGGIHDILQKLILKHVPFNSCTKYYTTDKRLPNGVVEAWQLCADGGGERIDTCHGDSGGPLQVKNLDNPLYTIVGITSLGIKCALVPSVYTRVSNYIPWLESIIWPDE